MCRRYLLKFFRFYFSSDFLKCFLIICFKYLIFYDSYYTQKRPLIFSDKNYGKTCYLDNFMFLALSLLNNIKNHWAKLASTYAMGLQHCVRSEGEFLNKLLNILIIFCHWLSQIYKKKKWKVKLHWSSASISAGNYMLKVNNRINTTRWEICSKLTIKIPKRRQWRRSGNFINFEHISYLVVVFLLLTLSM